jgi:hypothetical protein
MPSVGEVHGPDEAVDVEGIADWTSLQDAWGTSSFENRAFDPHATRAPVEAYDALGGGGLGLGGLGSSYEPSVTDGAVGGANRSYGGAGTDRTYGQSGGAGTYGQSGGSGAFGSYGAANSGSGQTSAPSYGSYTNGPHAPSYTTGPQAPQAPQRAGRPPC